jgi:hypothetical protein
MTAPLSFFSLATFAAGLWAAPLYSAVILTEDFEMITDPTGDIPTKFYKETTTNDSISVVSERARAGHKSLEIDFNFKDWRKNEPKRVEIYQVTAWGAEGMTLRKDWWVGFSQFLPVDWQADDPSNPDIIWQFHGWEGGPASNNPPLAAVIAGDQLYIRLSQGTVPALGATSYLDLAVFPIPRGVWTDVVLDLNFDYKNGHIKMWQNGVKIVDYSGPTLYPMIGQTNEKGPGFKIGVYKWDWGNLPTLVTRRSLYIDEIRFGDSNSSYAEVQPR